MYYPVPLFKYHCNVSRDSRKIFIRYLHACSTGACMLSMQMFPPELFQDVMVTMCVHAHCVLFEYKHLNVES